MNLTAADKKILQHAIAVAYHHWWYCSLTTSVVASSPDEAWTFYTPKSAARKLKRLERNMAEIIKLADRLGLKIKLLKAARMKKPAADNRAG